MTGKSKQYYGALFSGFLAVSVMSWPLSGCSGNSTDTSDQFEAGTWDLQGWMTSNQGSTQGQPGAQTDRVMLTPQQAANPPAAVFFSQFYHGEQDWSDVRFRDGTVSGSLHHGKSDVPLSGTYGRDHFQVTLSFGSSGSGFSQIVEGKLVSPAS